MSALLEVVDLHKSFGPVSVLRGAALSLEAREALARQQRRSGPSRGNQRHPRHASRPRAFVAFRYDRRHAACRPTDDAEPERWNGSRTAGDRRSRRGGTSLFGGRDTIGGCFIGAILFTTLGNGANLLRINPFWRMVIEGLLTAGVVCFDNLQKRRTEGQ
jgi:hypothetical protein